MSSSEKRKKKMEPESIMLLKDTPSKKKKTVTEKSAPMPEPTTILSLPDDLVLNCIAHLSRLHYPVLSRVSNRFPPLLVSPELYKYRSRLNRTESCLYVLLRNTYTNSRRWFTLCLKPDKAVDYNTGKHILVPIAYSESPRVRSPEFIASGSVIYSIGGLTSNFQSATVSFLDCRANKWCDAPSMRFDKIITSASVLNGKIYVIEGGYCNLTSIEMFDPETQIWSILRVPELIEINNGRTTLWRMVCFEGKLHLLSEEKTSVVYDPKKNKWGLVEREMVESWRRFHRYVVIENVFYRHDNVKFIWYDTKARSWKNVEGLPKFSCFSNLKMVDYGGKMAVLWREGSNIRCAVIELERRDGDEIWGKVEWLDNVFTITAISCDFLEAVSVTL